MLSLKLPRMLAKLRFRDTLLQVMPWKEHQLGCVICNVSVTDVISWATSAAKLSIFRKEEGRKWLDHVLGAVLQAVLPGDKSRKFNEEFFQFTSNRGSEVGDELIPDFNKSEHLKTHLPFFGVLASLWPLQYRLVLQTVCSQRWWLLRRPWCSPSRRGGRVLRLRSHFSWDRPFSVTSLFR